MKQIRIKRVRRIFVGIVRYRPLMDIYVIGGLYAHTVARIRPTSRRSTPSTNSALFTTELTSARAQARRFGNLM